METREMVIDGRVHQIEVYPEVTELDADELAYLARWTSWTPEQLAADPDLRRSLFDWIWTGRRGLCDVCGRSMSAGNCNNRDCIKVRVTNKLHLSDWMD